MVFLSAVCSKNFNTENFNYFDYFTKRCMRLIFPVWIFLSLYYVGVYIFYFLPPHAEILSGYMLLSDRYVWIIRILVLLSLMAPFLYKLTEKVMPLNLLLILCISCIICEVTFSIQNNKWVNLTLMTIPYGIIYLLGMNIASLSRKQIVGLIFAISFVLIGIAIYLFMKEGHFVPTSNYKYPPQIYYLSYAVAFTLFLWVSRDKIQSFLTSLHLVAFFKYVGRHTYWLYLWHIPFVDIFSKDYTFPIRFSIIFFGALSCVFIQDIIVRRFVTNKKLAVVFNG